MASELGEFIEILPPMKRVSDELVHGHGRRRLSEHLLHRHRESKCDLILSGDHIYKMNYG